MVLICDLEVFSNIGNWASILLACLLDVLCRMGIKSLGEEGGSWALPALCGLDDP